MIDLHTHTLLSDGCLVPSELVRRAQVIGYKVLAMTDHVDSANIDYVVPALVKVCKQLSSKVDIKLIPGCELTHIPPEDFKPMVEKARALGACIVVAHGETIAEPVIPGTNNAAIEAGVDILAHPGLITEDEVQSAASKKVCLEISARAGHCLGNGNVAKLALKYGARLVLNTDAHGPGDLITQDKANKVAFGAGLDNISIKEMIKNSTDRLVAKLLERCAVL